MSVIVPDDVWERLVRSHMKTARSYVKFVATHPEQCECINPTGKGINRNLRLLMAIKDANLAEKPKH